MTTALAADSADFIWTTAEGLEKDSDLSQRLGFIKMSDMEQAETAVYVELTLPEGVEWQQSIAGADGIGNSADDPDISAYIEGHGCTASAQLVSGDENEYVVRFDTDGTVSDWNDFYIKAKFDDMKISSGAADEIKAEIIVKGVSDSNVLFSESAVCLIGTTDEATITCSVEKPVSIAVGHEQELAEITWRENMPGALRVGDKFVLTLPAKFEWDESASDWEDALEGKYGLAATVTVADDEECILEITATSTIFSDSISFTGFVTAFPSAGDGELELCIEAELESDADFDDTSLVVAFVGEQQGIIEVEDDQDDNVYIGQIPAIMDTFTIKTTGGPFSDGDKIFLTLSPNAVWGINPPELSGDWEDQESSLCSVDLDWVGSFDDGRSIWLKVPDGEIYDEIEFTKMPAAVIPFDVAIPITITLGGTYDSEAAVIGPAPMAHADLQTEITPIDQSGLNLAAGAITLTEKGKDAFKAIAPLDIFNYIFLKLPTGVYFADEPTVTINGEETDVTLWQSVHFDYSDYHEDPGNPGETDPGTMPAPYYDEPFEAGQSSIIFIQFDDYAADFRDKRIDTVNISDITYDFDSRYKNVGPIPVAIGGTLLNDWLATSSVSGQELVETPLYSAVNTSSGTPRLFTIGSTSYSINGLENTMDVAPYISGERTYLPIRYVGYALGLTDNDILWDGVNQTVTLIKGNKVIQLKAGSTDMLVNGAVLAMDAAPEITGERLCLPVRFVAQAFGAAVGWDEAARTVSITI